MQKFMHTTDLKKKKKQVFEDSEDINRITHK